ncbi:MAG: DoxX family protein [Nocardioidaceae bacterium]
MTLVRLVARPMLASMFIVGGINSLKNPVPLSERAKPVTDKLQPLADRATQPIPMDVDAAMMVRANGLIHVAAGAMLATGRWPRRSSLVLAATLVPTTLAGHRFWEETDPGMRANQRVHFFKNLSMLGGCLLAGVDTEGKPSLAWRARKRAAKTRKRAGDIAPG